MQGLRILHLANDEKFIDQAIKAFEREAPGCNDLWVCGNQPLKYVKSKATIISRIDAILGTVKNDFSQYEIIVIHSLNESWFNIIGGIKGSPVLIWMGWGYDYYDVLNNKREDLFLPVTKQAWKYHIGNRRPIGRFKSFFKKLILPNKNTIIKKVDIFCPVLPPEYDLVKLKFGGKCFPRQGLWNYGNLEEDMIQGFQDERVSGKNILIGNSASPENNHLDAFEMIANFSLSEREIITPLSYGDARYRDYVIGAGKKYYGDSFNPLTEFMPIKEYIKTLQSCGFVVMNHLRQQAVGNIVIMMYLGAKIFLNKNCPTYSYLKNRGAVLFSTDDLKNQPDIFNSILDDISVEINRQVLYETWSAEISRKRTNELIDLALLIRSDTLNK